MTDNEIIKSLERMSEEDPEGFSSDILDFINRKQAEIERLKKKNESYAELEQGCYVTGYEKIRAEAIKEFTERLKETAYGRMYRKDVVYIVEIDNLVKEMEE